MTMDVSRLGIVVESTGINEARKALDGGNGNGGLYGAAAKTEKAVEKLTASMSKLLQVNATGTTAAWASAFGNMGGALANLSRTLQSTTTTLQAMMQAMNQTASATAQMTNNANAAVQANERFVRSGGVVTNTLKAMATAAVAYLSVNTVTSTVKMADSWQMMEARLNNATHSLNNARVAQEQMYELAQRLRVPLEDSVKLYTRLAPAVQRAGKSSEYAKDMVEGISTALQLSGANGAEASSVMLQLSQSFSSGVLNGAEFNAVAENGSVIMRALEKSTGKSTYELKKLGAEGKLSMEMVGKAIQESLPEWRKQFDTLPMTFEGAMTRLKNAWTKGVGELGQSTGFNKQLSDALLGVEKLIPMVLVGLGNAFSSVMTWIEKNKEKLSEIGEVGLVIISQTWELVKAFSTIAGDIATMGEGSSFWANVLKGVAYFVAAIADGFKVIASIITLTGLALAKLILLPMQGWAMIVQTLLEGFSSFIELAARGLRAIGKNDAADRMEGFAKSAQDAANTIGKTNDQVDGFMKAGAKMAVSWLDDIGRGEGALGKLWNAADKTEQKFKTIADLRKLEKGVMDEKAWGANPNPATPKDPKAETAAKNALKKYEDSLESLNAKLKDQLELQERLKNNGLDYDKVGPAMKEYIRLEEHVLALSDKNASQLELDRAMALRDKAMEIAQIETANERTIERLRAEKAIADAQSTRVQTLKDEADQLERQVATYGMAKGAVDALALADLQRKIADQQSVPEDLRSNDYESRLAGLRAELVERERIAAAAEKLGQFDSEKQFNKLMDARKAEKFGDVLANGFGKAGKSLGTLMNAFDKYAARQAKVSEAYKLAMKQTDPKIRAKEIEQASELEAESRITSYADMAGAAKGFFEEGTRGYKAMEAAEKTFRMFQMAMQLKTFLQEMGFLATTTSATVAADATKAASATASAAVQATASGVAGTAAAAAGVANQASGDPYTAFARMAAMAAIMAALGFAVFGGGKGGADVAKQRQEAQGTGTVFGDEKAKSESISKSLEIVSKNSDIALRYSSGMLSSLQNIEYSLTGATSGVIRTGGSVTGKGFETTRDPLGGIGGLGGAALLGGTIGLMTGLATKLPLIGGLVSKIVGGLFGSKTSLKDSGILAGNQSVGAILQSGFNVSAYQDVQTKKKAFGFTYSDKTSTNTSPIDPAVSREFGNIVSGMVDSLASAAGALGLSGDLVRQKLSAVNIDIGKISLKDLSSEEIQKQLEAVFSAIGDTLAKTALPQVEQFQKAGEGLLETVVRVATGVETANYELDKLGITAIKFTEVVNKSGDIGAEIVRQSILMQETGKGITEIISTLTGTATEIAETYKSLNDVRASLQALGLGSDVTRELIRAAGGLEALEDALASYTDNFFTDAEKSAMKTSALTKEFAKLGLVMPASKDGFRSLVESLSASGASGQELAMKVLLLSDAFADLHSSTDGLIQDARDDLADAYERESSALEELRDKFKDFSDSLKDFKSSLLTGDLSTLDVASKYQVEKAKFEEVLGKARAGDADAIGSFQNVATEFLNASRAMNASGAVYTSDFERVLAETDFIQGIAQGKVDTAQASLEALNKQVDGLLTVNNSVLTVAQAIQNLTALLSGTAGQGPTMSIMPVGPTQGIASATNAPSVSAQSMVQSNEALVAEVQALRTEVSALRADQAAQTAATIAANHDSNMQNAAAIVEGTANVASSTSYAERASTKLA